MGQRPTGGRGSNQYATKGMPADVRGEPRPRVQSRDTASAVAQTPTSFPYTILINANSRDKFFDGVKPADPLVVTWRGEIAATSSEDAVWQVIARHNQDDRPDGQIGPSFSAGDVVVVGEEAWTSVEGTAIALIDADHFTELNVIEDRPFPEVAREWREQSGGAS